MAAVTEPLSPDDIGPEFAARLVPELQLASVGDEQIVVGGQSQLMVLNPTAGLIFQFLDGEATLAELVDDFADALGAERDVVEADVLTFARELGANGLLQGVALPQPEFDPELWEQSDFEPSPPLEVGDEVVDFSLPTIDGSEHSLSEHRGRRVVLVNWSPGCGYCVKIADELSALEPLLAPHDVDLLYVSMGGAAANQALNEEHGITAPMVLRDGTLVDPFRGTGTPAAYLIDADGTLAETMLVGANQVPMLLRDLAGVDPTVPFGDAGAVPVDDHDDGCGHEHDPAAELDGEVRGRYLPAPGAMCGPGGGGSASNSTDWSGTRAYALGGFHVGIRHDTTETALVLDRLFAGARVNDRRVPDNYSVALGAPIADGAGSSQSLKLLVHGSTQLVRSRSAARVLAALLQRVSGDLERPDPSLMVVDATPALRDGEALLLPRGLLDFVKQLQPRLAKERITIVDTPYALVDLGTRELVVPDPVVPHDAAVLEELDAGVRLGSELPWVRPGRYPLRAWFLTRSPAQVGPFSPARAVASAIPSVYDVDDVLAEVERLASLFDHIPAYGIWYESEAELVREVARSLRGDLLVESGPA